jgi:hypothetical protein
MIQVNECEDGRLEISWDANDLAESMFNDWTEEDFIRVIGDYCNGFIEEHEDFPNFS